MSYDKNPYYHPEALGLTTVAEVEYSDGCWQFDTRVVWRHDATGALYTKRDSGCSCPSPFEDYCSLELLDRVDITDLTLEIAREQNYDGYSGNTYIDRDGAAFLRKVQEAIDNG